MMMQNQAIIPPSGGDREDSYFLLFRDKVNERIEEFKKTPNSLFLVKNSGPILSELYLRAYPQEVNPIYKTRPVKDCNSCLSFIRQVGGLIRINPDLTVSTIWDVAIPSSPLDQSVANIMRDKVIELEETSELEFFKSINPSVSCESNRDMMGNKYSHFYARFPKNMVISDKWGGEKSKLEGLMTSAKNGFENISFSALEKLEELKAANIYRLEEHLPLIDAFAALQKQYLDLQGKMRERFLYLGIYSGGGAVWGFKNTVAGSFLLDLSDDTKSIDACVRSFETKMGSYQRTQSVVTPSMLKKAKELLKEHNLLESLERRPANLDDLSLAKGTLWLNPEAKERIGKSKVEDFFSELGKKLPKKGTKSKKDELSKIPSIDIKSFIKEVLPKAESMKVLVEDTSLSHLVSLITEKHKGASPLFKWNNPFSWNYFGNGESNADASIAKKVKAAGGNITAQVRASLSWSNLDDLDLHVEEPNGNRIYHGSRRSNHSLGHLDVDMNVSPITRDAVENIYWEKLLTMPDGNYNVIVRQYTLREKIDVGFNMEIHIENIGDWQLRYPHLVKSREDILVGTFTVEGSLKNKKTISFTPSPNMEIGTAPSRTEANLTTGDWVEVEAITLSPNHWEEEIGNLHYFFFLKGAKTESFRGFFNEFLRSDLKEVRKAMDVIGATMKVDTDDDQLTGLGFSSTSNKELLVKVEGSSITSTYKIKF